MEDQQPTASKPSGPAQAAKALSQLGLTFYVLLLLMALLATSGKDPRFAILMAVCALVPVIFGPLAYRVAGIVALLIAASFYVDSSAPPKPGVRPAPPPQQAPAEPSQPGPPARP